MNPLDRLTQSAPDFPSYYNKLPEESKLLFRDLADVISSVDSDVDTLDQVYQIIYSYVTISIDSIDDLLLKLESWIPRILTDLLKDLEEPHHITYHKDITQNYLSIIASFIDLILGNESDSKILSAINLNIKQGNSFFKLKKIDNFMAFNTFKRILEKLEFPKSLARIKKILTPDVTTYFYNQIVTATLISSTIVTLIRDEQDNEEGITKILNIEVSPISIKDKNSGYPLYVFSDLFQFMVFYNYRSNYPLIYSFISFMMRLIGDLGKILIWKNLII